MTYGAFDGMAAPEGGQHAPPGAAAASICYTKGTAIAIPPRKT